MFIVIETLIRYQGKTTIFSKSRLDTLSQSRPCNPCVYLRLNHYPTIWQLALRWSHGRISTWTVNEFDARLFHWNVLWFETCFSCHVQSSVNHSHGWPCHLFNPKLSSRDTSSDTRSVTERLADMRDLRWRADTVGFCFPDLYFQMMMSGVRWLSG